MGTMINSFQGYGDGDGAPLFASVAFSGVAFAITYSLIRWLGPVFMKAGLKGKDMAKPKKPEMYVLRPTKQSISANYCLVQRQWEPFVRLYIFLR